MKSIIAVLVALFAFGTSAQASSFQFAGEKKAPGQDEQRDDQEDQQDDQQDDQEDQEDQEDGNQQDDHADQDDQEGQDESDQHDDYADQDDQEGQDDDEVGTMFNVACFYNDAKQVKGFRSCKANAIFTKNVTADGGEVADESPTPTHPLSTEIPQFKVECENTSLWNDHGRRFTDLLSTRIQALSGPFPAIYLPRGALHVGPHVSDSYLEIETDMPKSKPIRIVGKCHIWTGAPLK